jgi:PAS domain S-box-containing protein
MAFDTFDVLAAVAQRFPTYCIHDYCFDHGAIGGSYPDSGEQTAKGGELAARVLAGEKPQNLPVVYNTGAQSIVDWRQLRRWNIAESKLPAHTLVLYRQPTVWERYERYIVAGIVLIVVQSLLIVALLWQRTRKRKTEARLRESEQRFRGMADTVPALVWMSDPDWKMTYLNRRKFEFTGEEDIAAGLGDTWMNYIHPEDLESVIHTHQQALKSCRSFSHEFRLRRSDDSYRWMLSLASPRKDRNGAFAGFIGSATDVTDQRLAQTALEQIGGKLIAAQEAERGRIARELHDDICQRLAMLTLELEQASEGPVFSSERLMEIVERYSGIALDVQALSHQLHSSKLEYLGIVAGLRAFCQEFSEQQSVRIDFTPEDVPAQLAPQISLCLFRIAQEALHNAVKHSGASDFTVRLLGAPGWLELEIVDNGSGFDVESARSSSGLGLVSMQERAHLLHGVLSIDSQPNAGTRIIVRLPVEAVTRDPIADSVVTK